MDTEKAAGCAARRSMGESGLFWPQPFVVVSCLSRSRWQPGRDGRPLLFRSDHS
jgi:hypothetical protein